MKAACWLDQESDRYGAAVRQKIAEFAETWGDVASTGFAATAWRIATELEPAYLRRHPRVISATCRRNTWDGTLTCEAAIAAPWPAELSGNRHWTQDRGWRDWPQTFGQYLTPTDHDVVRAPHLRTQLLVAATIPPDHLPPTPPGPAADEVEHAARRAVAVIARELNDLLGPLLTQLERNPRPTPPAAGSAPARSGS
ncbi:hypothetical protein [Asanoa iriomotensis]|uniref:Uncharacterized protein n=1 Tax=Asanoa iriomotensis TaxID=234613 RepID=A0ABQ4BW73_9ACTN|nr:hypothetical protein [Asanoa iriomotensis]GIF54767.1 hypothetical protein Air01nite_08620 [Asanoa iriomotensis]